MLKLSDQFFNELNNANDIAITLDKSWAPDSVASGLALSLLLAKLGKTVTLAADFSERKNITQFLPNFNNIKSELAGAQEFIINLDLGAATLKNLKYQINNNLLKITLEPETGSLPAQNISGYPANFNYNLIININAPELSSLGNIYHNQPEFFYDTPIINFGHTGDHENYGQINLVELQASATSEIIYNLFNQTDLIDADIATCLLAGLIGATHNFKTKNLRPRALSIAADLVSLGARREEIIENFYGNKKLNTLKLWGTGLTNLAITNDNKLAWTCFDYQDLKTYQVGRQDILALVEELIANLPHLAAAAIFISKGAETTALIYSLKNYDALELAAPYSPKGDRQLAQFVVPGELSTIIQQVISQINKNLN